MIQYNENLCTIVKNSGLSSFCRPIAQWIPAYRPKRGEASTEDPRFRSLVFLADQGKPKNEKKQDFTLSLVP